MTDRAWLPDFAYGRPGGRTIKAAGACGVMRYLNPGVGDEIDQGEVNDYAGAGLPIGTVLEREASWILGGKQRGRNEAFAAAGYGRNLGLPDGLIYGTVDFEITSDVQREAIADTLAGMAEVIGWANVGIYGGYSTVDYVLTHTPVVTAWQCEAWSYGRLHPRAVLFQHAQPIYLGGVQCDQNTVIGDWRPRGSTGDDDMKMPRTINANVGGPPLARQAPIMRRLYGLLRSVGGLIDVDCTDAHQLEANVRQAQKNMGLKVDGIVGPIMWGKLLDETGMKTGNRTL